ICCVVSLTVPPSLIFMPAIPGADRRLTRRSHREGWRARPPPTQARDHAYAHSPEAGPRQLSSVHRRHVRPSEPLGASTTRWGRSAPASWQYLLPHHSFELREVCREIAQSAKIVGFIVEKSRLAFEYRQELDLAHLITRRGGSERRAALRQDCFSIERELRALPFQFTHESGDLGSQSVQFRVVLGVQ